MFENVLADLRHYQAHFGSGRKSLLWTALTVSYTHPAAAGVILYRFGNWSWRLRIPGVREICKLLYVLLLPAVRMYSGVQIHPCAEIGKGLVIGHFGGVVICREAKIGEQCVLHHNVSIVTTNSRIAAQIGDYFYAGTGVTIVGNLVIEDNVICGAGSVITKSVPANAIISGVPAKILRFRRENEKPPVYVRGHQEQAPFMKPGE
ncbi:MAG: serine O-acetyltransferase [Planctomycetota bacterium]|jgi:serine O-acetyltransferase